LVIDEHGSLREALLEALQVNYSVEVASNNQEGLELATRHMPDLIITDLAAANIDGASICFLLKQSQKTSHIPIVILASQDDTVTRMRSFYLGADDFMKMPFHMLELQIRIQNLIQSRKALQEKFTRQVEFKPSPAEGQSEDEVFLQQVLKIIEENMADPGFGSEDFARQLGLSQTRLYRKLIALTGYSSNDFIRRMRLQRAADLLTRQVGNVSEVAYQVGFNSLSYFAKCFKQLHEASPRDYAKQASLKS
jgi:AraC-like DNA-binding protein/CheY-like chemotaxis protein